MKKYVLRNLVVMLSLILVFIGFGFPIFSLFAIGFGVGYWIDNKIARLRTEIKVAALLVVYLLGIFVLGSVFGPHYAAVWFILSEIFCFWEERFYLQNEEI